MKQEHLLNYQLKYKVTIKLNKFSLLLKTVQLILTLCPK